MKKTTQLNRDKILKDLFTFLRIPSVSTLSEHKKDVAQAASWLVDYFSTLGLTAGLVETSGHPLVYGNWQKMPNQPTVLFYGHYDVQPPDPLDGWETPPFAPAIRDGKLFARGAADNKGQLFINLGAVKELLALERKLPVNVAFVVEGEEEIGSPNFAEGMAKVSKKIKADAALVTDVGMPKAGHPVLIYGLRGIVYFELTLTGPNHDLHSGTYGGMVQNPAAVLVKILHELKDDCGRVKAPGFYNEVLVPTESEKETLAKVPRTEEDEKDEAGVDVLIFEPGFTPRESAKIRPSLEINGIQSGFTGEGAKTIIPAKASAKFSIRLVPNQNPKQVSKEIIKYVESLCPAGVSCEVEVLTSSPAVMVDPQSDFAKIVGESLEVFFGRPPVLNRLGGSVPAAGVLAGMGLPVIITGFTLPDDRIHAPNENLDLPHFYKGIEVIKEILRRAQSLKT